MRLPFVFLLGQHYRYQSRFSTFLSVDSLLQIKYLPELGTSRSLHKRHILRSRCPQNQYHRGRSTTNSRSPASVRRLSIHALNNQLHLFERDYGRVADLHSEHNHIESLLGLGGAAGGVVANVAPQQHVSWIREGTHCHGFRILGRAGHAGKRSHHMASRGAADGADGSSSHVSEQRESRSIFLGRLSAYTRS